MVAVIVLEACGADVMHRSYAEQSGGVSRLSPRQSRNIYVTEDKKIFEIVKSDTGASEERVRTSVGARSIGSVERTSVREACDKIDSHLARKD